LPLLYFTDILSSARELGDSLFLGRKSEIVETFMANFNNNQAARRDDKNLASYCMCVAAQAKGAGKTALLNSYVPQLSNGAVVDAIMQAAVASAGAGVADAARADLEAMKTAVVVLVSCTTHYTADGVLMQLAHQLASKCRVALRNLPESARLPTASASEFLSQVLKVARRTHAVFLGIDAISNETVEYRTEDYKTFRSSLLQALRESTTVAAAPAATTTSGDNPPAGSSSATPSADTPSASQPLHIMAAGLLDAGNERSWSQSPVERDHRVCLEALALPHIEEIIDRYHLWPAEQNGLGELRRALATALRNATAGCPQPVHIVLSVIKILQLDVGNRDAISTTVADVAMALLETDEEPYKQHGHHMRYSCRAYADLAVYSMLNMDLDCSAGSTDSWENRWEGKLLDHTMRLPIMFETAGNGKRIPRIAPILTRDLRKELPYIKLNALGNDFDEIVGRLPRVYGVLRVVQRGFLPHYLIALFDASYILPLEHLVPFLPNRHRGIYVRVSSVMPQIQHHEVKTEEPSIAHFLKLEADVPTAAPERPAGQDAVWHQNQELCGKVLMVTVSDSSRNPVVDGLLWVPATAQCAADGAALHGSARSLLIQLKSRSLDPSAPTRKVIEDMATKEMERALLHPDVDAVCVVFTRNLSKQWGFQRNDADHSVDVIMVPKRLANVWVKP
jgi:hypothetical protein